jgi:adenylate cyclase
MAGWTLSGFTAELTTAANVIDRALTLNPNSAHAWVARGLVSVIQDRPDQAIEPIERAIRLSPLDPWGGRAFTSPLAMAHFAAGRYEEAIQWAVRALAAQPDYRPAMRIKAAYCVYLDWTEEARNWLGRVLQIEPSLTLARVRASVPQFSPELRARYVDGLRKAGLPGD